MTATDDEIALPALARAEERYPLSCRAPYLRGVRLLGRPVLERHDGVAAAGERPGVLAVAGGLLGHRPEQHRLRRPRAGR